MPLNALKKNLQYINTSVDYGLLEWCFTVNIR